MKSPGIEPAACKIFTKLREYLNLGPYSSPHMVRVIISGSLEWVGNYQSVNTNHTEDHFGDRDVDGMILKLRKQVMRMKTGRNWLSTGINGYKHNKNVSYQIFRYVNNYRRVRNV
jgi:hypothetical protein